MKDNGEVSSTETRTDPANANDVLQTSTKNSYWFWSNDAQNKTTVNMDLSRGCWNLICHMIYHASRGRHDLDREFSDNYQQNETR